LETLKKGWREIIATILKDAAIILAVTVFLFVALELGIRAYFFIKLGPEEYLKYEYRHDPVYSVRDERELNSIGFRGAEFSVNKPKDVYRIIMVGGSEVFGVYVDLKDSLPYILEQKLKEAYPDRKFEVINAGRLGSVAANEALLMDQLVSLNPDHIIVFNGWNDIYHFRYLPDQYHKVMVQTTKKFRWDKSLSRWLRRHLWTIRKIREWKDEKRRNRRGNPEETVAPVEDVWSQNIKDSKELSGKPGERWIKVGWSGGAVFYPMSQLKEPTNDFAGHYYTNLVRMAKTAERKNIPITFIFQPDLGYLKLKRALNLEEAEAYKISTTWFSEDWFHTVEKIYPVGIDTMSRAAADENIPFYDYSLVLLDAKQNGFGDTVHLNAYGNQVVAGKMLEMLKPIVEETNG